MSHFTYAIGALPRIADSAPARWSTTSGRPRSRTSLLTALGPVSAVDADDPLGMGAIEVAVRADHLRLDPQTEAKPEVRDRTSDAVDPVGQLAPIDDPVAERAIVRIALAEPAVVEHEELHAEVARGRGDPDEPVVVEVEVGPFPVVEDDRPRPIAPPTARQSLAIQRMERVGHGAQAVIGPDDHRLRCREHLARVQRPAERLWRDADADSGGAEGIDLRLGEEVARVDQADAVGLAVLLVRGRAAQAKIGVVLGTRRPPSASEGPSTRREWGLDDVRFARPCAGQPDAGPVGVGQVQRQAHRGQQLQRTWCRRCGSSRFGRSRRGHGTA